MSPGNQINMPGWNDTIHIIPTPLRDPELEGLRKRAQYLAMLNSTSPEIVQRANQWITMLDDAEDLLSTALVLGRPLIRRLPSRLVPGFGWILLGGDVIDLATWALSLTSTGLLQKRNVGEQVRNLSFRRGNRIRRVEQFNRMTPGFGALVEGLQVTDNFVGVGLSLGPMMSLASDFIWGIMRSLAGERVRLRIPRRLTLEQQAALVTWQTPPMLARSYFLPIDLTHVLHTAAQMAMDITRATSDILREAGRFSTILNEPIPQFLPDKAITRQVIRDQGIDPDRIEEPIGIPKHNPHTTILQSVTEISQQGFDMGKNYRAQQGRTLQATWTAMGILEMADTMNSWVSSEPRETTWFPNGSDMATKTMVEYGYTFGPGTEDWRKVKILTEITKLALQRKGSIFA